LQQYSMQITIGGKDITEYLSQLMSHESMYFHLDTSYRIATTIKEKYCYVARDFKSENNISQPQIFTLPDGRQISINKERYEATELLFNPHDPLHQRNDPRNKQKNNNAAMHKQKALDHAVISCVNQLDDDDVEKDMYSNVICCGGTSKLQNFGSRLQREVTNLLSRKMSVISPEQMNAKIKVKMARDPQLSAWMGCQMISNQSNFDNCWITNEEYHEYGPNILQRKCTHQDL